MIPNETLINTIIEFDKKRKELDKSLENEETHTLELFRECRDMNNTWNELQNVVEKLQITLD
jgi:hypothetical protein